MHAQVWSSGLRASSARIEPPHRPNLLIVDQMCSHRSESPLTTRLSHPELSPTGCQIACLPAVAVGLKALLLVRSERSESGAVSHDSLIESSKANSVNPLTYLTYILSTARARAAQLPTPDVIATLSTAPALGPAI